MGPNLTWLAGRLRSKGTEHWNRLVLHSGRTSRELSTKASAWRIAGSAGVEIVESSRDVLEINKFVQFRKNELAQWFRFEKISGRWKLISGPAMDPATLESGTDDTTASDWRPPSLSPLASLHDTDQGERDIA